MNIFQQPTRLWGWFIKRSLLQKILIILIVAILGWLTYSQTLGSKKQTAQIQTAPAQRDTLVVSTSASGNVINANFMNVTTQASGVVANVYVKDGDYVEQGQKIADVTLDQQGQKSQRQAWSNYLSAKTSLDAAQATQYSLQSDMFTKWKTFMDLAQNSTYQNSDGTPNNTNRALPEFHVAQDDWLATEAKYKNQQAVISQTQSAVSSAWTTYQLASPDITAPISGTIKNVTIIPGMPLTSSSGSSSTDTGGSAQRVAVIENEGTPIISLNLTEIDIANIKPGQRATVTFDAIKDKTFTGRVMTIDRIGSTSNGVTTYPVTIQLDTAVPEILPNMSATANIITQTKTNVLLVPSTAVQTQNGESTVRVMRNGQMQSVPVEVGASSDTQTEIVSGLKEGDTVVTSVVNASLTTPQRGGNSVFGGGFGGGFRGGGGGNIRVIR